MRATPPRIPVLPLVLLTAVAAASAFGADSAPAGAAVEGGAFDWRAFLAPFHSVTLHLPIGFILLACILDAYYIFHPSPQLRKGVTLAIIVSALSAAAVAGLGYLRAAGGGYDPVTLHTHKIYGVVVAIVTGVLAVVDIAAYRGEGRRLLRVTYRVLLVADLAIVGLAGHYGGHLTHGSKYLVENAPEWAKDIVEEFDNTLTIGDPVETVETETFAGNGIYAEKIQPIFEAKCYQCHGPEKQKGDYRIDNPKDALASGDSELPAIVPFRPRESYLVDVITLPKDADEVMPPEGKEPLTAEETLAIIQWIHIGAPFGTPGEPPAVAAEN